MKPRRSPRGPGPADSKKETEAIGTKLRSFPSIRRTTRRSNASPSKATATATSPEMKAAPALKLKSGSSQPSPVSSMLEEAELKQPARKVKDDNKAASEAEPAETAESKQKATNAVRQSSRRSSRFSATTSDEKEEEQVEEAPIRSMTRRSTRHSAGAAITTTTTTGNADTNGSVKAGKGKEALVKKEEDDDEDDKSLSENEKSPAKAIKSASANGSEVGALPILGKRKASEEGIRDAKKAGRFQQEETEHVSGDSSDNNDKDKNDDEDGNEKDSARDDDKNDDDEEEDDEERKNKDDGIENDTAREDHGKGEEDGNENEIARLDDSKNGENGKHEDEITEKPPPRRSHRHRDKTIGIRKSPNELDESTLQAVKTYLSENINGDEVLDEVELVSFMLRMDRLSTEQTRYQQKLVGDSDEEDDELYNDILAEEEEHALGQSFFKSMVHKVKKQNDEISLDKGTLDWIRRAAGLQKNNLLVHSRQTATASREPGATGVTATRMSAKRYTRGMAKTSRTQKRKKDMRHLTDAVDELEKEFGPFERKRPEKRSRENRRSVSPHKADDDEPIIPIDPPLKRKKKVLVARMPMPMSKPKSTKHGIIDKRPSTRDVRVSKVLVDGEHIGAGTHDWDVVSLLLLQRFKQLVHCANLSNTAYFVQTLSVQG
jgi:hypothetical protein